MNTSLHLTQNSLQFSIQPIHTECIALIEQEDFSQILKTVSKETGIMDEAFLEEGVRQLKCYYTLCAIDPLNPHGVSSVVDPFWHAHILHSRVYSKFCDQVYGGYLHHEPLDPSNEKAAQAVGAAYEYTREAIAQAFGELDERWWPDSKIHPEVLICTHYDVQAQSLKDAALFPRRDGLFFDIAA